jgi:hypothetical protein
VPSEQLAPRFCNEWHTRAEIDVIIKGTATAVQGIVHCEIKKLTLKQNSLEALATLEAREPPVYSD